MDRTASPLFRRVVLGCALALALTVALPSRPPAAFAQPAPAPANVPAVPSPPAPPAAPESSTAASPGTDKPATDKRKRSAIEITARVRDNAAGVTATDAADAADESAAQDQPPTSGKSRGRVHVRGLGGRHDYDSFGDMVDRDPAIAGMVIAVVAIVFLTPLLIVIAVMSYRMRKARMLNETLLKLAEKGVAPPAELMQAVASGDAAQALASSPTTASLVQQAQAIRRRAAWSDLRKGIILGGLGIAFCVHGLFEDRSPGIAGLILLFLGIAYGVLWWFENKPLQAGTTSAPGSGA